MTQPTAYKEQLKELYQTYTGKELEQAIGVSTRSIQNYLKEEKPSLPGPEVVRKIREAYAKHQKEGVILNKESTPEGVDLKDKYITLLEATVREKSELIHKVETSLALLPESMQMLTDLILQGQTALLRRMEENFEALTRKLSESPDTAGNKKPSRMGKH
jgi:hypothetical protein